MPYISTHDRYEIGKGVPPQTAGELNFAMTILAINYLVNNGVSYQTIADISSAFTEGLAEFRRRVTAPYEDKKIQENGDLNWPEV